ncbi:MAG: hypothetical protein KJZ90_00850 [Rhodocyclaceae bacterium]|nr:hypothetical protein [Rhodocyclaceae bacterium]
MKIRTSVNCTDDALTDNPDWVLIDIGPVAMARIIAVAKACRQLADQHSVQLIECRQPADLGTEWRDDITQQQAQDYSCFEDGEMFIADVSVNIGDEDNLAYDTLCVSNDAFCVYCMPKHGSTRIESRWISFDWVPEIASALAESEPAYA